MVSVVIPVYKAERYVRRAVESALAQEETGEVLLVEDNSPDNALAVCHDLERQNAKVRVLRHPDGTNRGISASRNLGIVSAKFEYIAFLDADDYYLPGRFQVAMGIFLNDAYVDGVYEATKVEFENEEFRQEWIARRWSILMSFKEVVSNEQLMLALIKRTGWFHADAIVVKKAFFIKTGLFDEDLKLAEDYAMWIKMAAIGRLVAGSMKNPVSVFLSHCSNNAIHRSPEEWREAHLNMWRIVLKWGISKKMGTMKRRLLLDKLISMECEEYAKNPVIFRHLQGVLHMLRYIHRYPYLFNLPDIVYTLYNRSGIIGVINALTYRIANNRD
jgi:glycosyltransferase involved in cell wall biosynthesis